MQQIVYLFWEFWAGRRVRIGRRQLCCGTWLVRGGQGADQLSRDLRNRGQQSLLEVLGRWCSKCGFSLRCTRRGFFHSPVEGLQCCCSYWNPISAEFEEIGSREVVLESATTTGFECFCFGFWEKRVRLSCNRVSGIGSSFLA